MMFNERVKKILERKYKPSPPSPNGGFRHEDPAEPMGATIYGKEDPFFQEPDVYGKMDDQYRRHGERYAKMLTGTYGMTNAAEGHECALAAVKTTWDKTVKNDPIFELISQHIVDALEEMKASGNIPHAAHAEIVLNIIIPPEAVTS